MSALTDGGSKEMLPLGGRPVIAWVIQEAKDSGAEEVIVISAKGKADLNAYLDTQPVTVMMQESPIGLGPAVALALEAETCMILLPDSTFSPASPALRLAEAVREGVDLAIAFRKIPDSQVSRYGIAEERDGVLAGLVEKPSLADAPSRWAVNGRYAFSATSSQNMRRLIEESLPLPGQPELPLTPAIQALLKTGAKGGLIICSEEETRHDCGSPEGYLAAKEVFG